jgi:hypothetical protein
MDRRALLVTGAVLGMAGFASSAAEAAVLKPTPTVFDFGAVGDGITDDSLAFSRALQSAATKGHTIIVPGQSYAIAKPIVFNSTADIGRTWGLQCQGAKLISKITTGENIMTLTAKHVVRYFRISGGLTIQGTGSDGNGLHLAALSSSVFFYNAFLEGVSVERVGGHGLMFEGNVFESTMINSYFQDCRKNGATFAHSKGGVCSAITVLGCYFNQNGAHGLAAINLDAPYGGATDIRVYGGYCRDNQNYGFYYNNGTAGGALEQVGFENNCRALPAGDPNGAHIYALSSIQLRNCTGYNEYGGATYLLRGYFVGLTLLDSCNQGAGGAVAATGKSRLVQVNGTPGGHVLMRASNGGLDVVPGTACTWEAAHCSGPAPTGALNPRGSIASA